MSEQSTKKTSTFQQENRAFKSEWEKEFFKIDLDNKAHCLLCFVVINVIHLATRNTQFVFLSNYHGLVKMTMYIV